MESEVYEVELEFDRESETTIRLKEEIHCHLHYKSPRPERHERSERKMCSLLLLAALVENLNRSLGMNKSLTLINFIRRTKNVTFKSIHPDLFELTQISIRFGECKTSRLNRAAAGV